jgi:hypothetical protein
MREGRFLAGQWFWPGAEPENPGLEEDLAMSEREPAPGSSGGKPGNDSDVLDEAREDALMREVIRMQERHREGGVEPELDGGDADPEPGG